MKKLHKRQLPLMLVLIALSTSACLKIPPSGVSVKSATANLVFGVPPIVEDAPPPGFEGPPPEVVVRPTPGVTFTPIVKPTERCPTASDTTYPEQAADTEVVVKPKEGLYLWKLRGRDQELDPELGHPTIVFDPFDFRGIGGVSDGKLNFEFSTGQYERVIDSSRGLTYDFVVQTFKIVQTGSGDKGIFLAKVLRYRDPRTGPDEFRPEPAVMLAKLPIKLPMEIRSAGVDPDTLAAITVTGELAGRRRLDVCGKVIDSWAFKTQQQFTSATGANFTRNYEYAFATQFGGYVAWEYVESPPAEADTEPHLLYETNIGALEPRDLPPDFEKYMNP